MIAARRSTPSPMPPVGGNPYSSAVRKSSSMGCVSSSPGARLVDEPGALVIRVVQLGEGIRDLFTGDEELEPVRQSRVASASPRQRRDLDRVTEDEGRLHQRLLHQL